jgi:hypothetical protein
MPLGQTYNTCHAILQALSLSKSRDITLAVCGYYSLNLALNLNLPNQAFVETMKRSFNSLLALCRFEDFFVILLKDGVVFTKWGCSCLAYDVQAGGARPSTASFDISYPWHIEDSESPAYESLVKSNMNDIVA